VRRSLPRPSRRLIAVGAAATALAAGGAFAAQRHWTRRWRAGDDALAEAGLRMVDELVHHDVAISDGGVIHAVELGEGPAIVLVHGVTLSDAVWVRQFAALAGRHRVIAIDQRGHGPSVAGDDGYTFDRLAQDVLDVLEALAVRNAVLVGHSMGGMVSLTAALAEPDRMAEHVAGLVLVGTTAGPVTGVSLWPVVTDRMAALTGRSLASAGRKGRGLFPGEDLASWSTRMAFGSRPTALDLELTRSLTSAMSPTAMADLLVSLVGFDVRARLGEIRLPTRIVVGSRDLLLPPFHARRMAAGIPHAVLEVLPGCGHMVMLERADELNELLHRFSVSLEPETGAA
jgi:non-heme chloroperoxidase